jgi:chaperonin cofactor prefoldin
MRSLSERARSAELVRERERERSLRENLPSLIDEKVGEHIDKLETKLVDSFREMGQRVVEESTEALTAQLDGRISSLEQISALQTDTINLLRDSSRESEQKVSGVVSSIEQALGDAVPGFRLAPPSHLPPQLNAETEVREPVRIRERSVDDAKDGKFCPNCTSTSVRRATRHGVWEEVLRLFFLAPYRCRACRHKFYRF